MSMSGFLRERIKGVSDNIVATLLLAGGSALIGWLAKNWALIVGLGLGWSLVTGAVVFLILITGLSLLLKPKQEKPNQLENIPQPQMLPQSGIHVSVNPVFNNSPQISQQPAISQSQSQEQISKQTNTEHNLVPLEARIGVTETCKEYYRLKEARSYEKGKNFRAAIAEFSNEVVLGGREVASLRHVKARITYYTDTSRVYWRSSAGWWVDNEYNTISFEPHDIRKLILAASLEETGYTAFANHHESYRDGYDKIEDRILEGDKFRVEVQLIAGGTMVGCFTYNLLLKPIFGIKLIEPIVHTNDKDERLGLTRELETLLKEGLQKLRDENYMGAAFWEVEVKMRIEKALGSWQAEEFSKETNIKLYPYPAMRRRQADMLYTRTERLGAIISELKKD